MFTVWPRADAFKAKTRPTIDLWSMKRYDNDREESKARRAEVFDAMPDLTSEQNKPLAMAMGRVAWIRKCVR